MQKQVYKDNMAVAEALAEKLLSLSKDSSFRTIALSGGSTPKVLFDLLAKAYGQKMPWQQLEWYWGDERCVPPEDSESNYGMTRSLLLEKVPVPEGNVHRVRGEDPPEKEAIRYAAELRRRLHAKEGLPCFDLVILGMGDDGHTASIFPHQMELWDSPALCEVATHPESGQKRISLTGKVINNAALVIFLVTGKSKAGPVAEILKKEGKYKSYPASRVNPTDGKLIWMLDEEAASGL
ncbi:6-phosphogluconolactonase [Robiginitalea sp. IMCC44478]|uniref:6-phosphogluconolactonase n=1 Tax=Robiginitalea sp. IMCC44478 TaxID=3459122 RepID=UPI0040421C24